MDGAATRLPRILAPLRRREVAYLLGGHFGSRVGDSVFLVGLALWALHSDPTGTLLARYFLAASVGSIAALAAGAFISDRMGPRRLLLTADLVRCAATLALALSVTFGQRSEILATGVGAIMGIGGGIFGPARNRAYAELVPAGELISVNSLRTFADDGGRLSGAALAGAMVLAEGPGVAIFVDSATFFLSFACVWMIASLRNSAAPGNGQSNGRARILPDFMEGMSFIRKRDWIWKSIVAQSAHLVLCFGPMAVTIPLYITRVLHGGAGAFAAVVALQGALTMASTLVLGQWAKFHRTGIFLYSTLIGIDILFVGAAASRVVAVSVALFALVGAFMAVFDTLWQATLQRHVDTALQGRIGSVDFLLSMGLEPVSLALLPVVVSWFSVRGILITTGCVGIAIAALCLGSTSIRSLTT